MNEDVIIERDDEYRTLLMNKLKADMGIGVRRTGVHVSDMIFCVRKAWAERVTEHIPAISDGTVLTWLRGLSHEALVSEGVEQVRAGYCFTCQKNLPWTPDLSETQRCPTCSDTLMVGTIDWVQLTSPDGVNLEDFVPVEMKSTMKSSRKTLEEGDMAWFIDQIKSYMAMHGRKKGRVAVLHIMGDYKRTDPDIKNDGPEAELRVYSIRWRSEHDAANWLAELRARKFNIEDPSVMPPLGTGFGDASPAHPFICQYCAIGERLPNGQECENWPWRFEPTLGKYVKKTSNIRKVGLDEMLAELSALQEGHDKNIHQALVNVALQERHDNANPVV